MAQEAAAASETTTETTESADPKVGAGNSQSPSDSSPGDTSSSQKPAFNWDKAIKEDLRAKRDLKTQEADLHKRKTAFESESKQYEPLKPLLEPLSKVDQAAVVKALTAFAAGDKKAAYEAMFGLDPELVVGIAEHVASKVDDKQPLSREDALSIARQEIEADKKKAEEKAKADQEAAALKEKQEFEAELKNYTATLGKALKAEGLKAKFPLCARLAHRLPLERIEAEVTRRANGGESVAMEDVLTVFETEFRADFDPPKVETAKTKTIDDEIKEALAQLDAEFPADDKTVRVSEVKPPVNTHPVGSVDADLDRLQKQWEAERRGVRF
jgi:hypothetical protein